jgi:hypothetical protein
VDDLEASDAIENELDAPDRRIEKASRTTLRQQREASCPLEGGTLGRHGYIRPETSSTMTMMRMMPSPPPG